jgi:hypothetical protein
MRGIGSRLAVIALSVVAACNSSEPSGPAAAQVPTGVKASIAGGTIDLTWNGISGALGYRVYMAEVGGVTRVNVTTLQGNMTHTDLPTSFAHPAGLNPSTKFFFVVTAVRADSTESAESCEVNAKIGTNEATAC